MTVEKHKAIAYFWRLNVFLLEDKINKMGLYQSLLWLMQAVGPRPLGGL